MAAPLIEPVARLIESFARLPGIGPKLSQRIMDERAKKRFATVADLRRVESELETIRQEIVAGKLDFGEAAKKYSDCPSKDKGGDIGPFPYKFVVVEPFARAAWIDSTCLGWMHSFAPKPQARANARSASSFVSSSISGVTPATGGAIPAAREASAMRHAG